MICPDLFSEEIPCGSILWKTTSLKQPISLRILGGSLREVWPKKPAMLVKRVLFFSSENLRSLTSYIQIQIL